MNAPKSNRITDRGIRIPLIACFVLFALYLINVLFGKINILYGLNLPHLSDVDEFLLLFGACTLIIIAALKYETTEKMLLTQTRKKEV